MYTSDFASAWAELRNFHRRNGTEVLYRPPVRLERTRAGRVTPPERVLQPRAVRVLMDWNPTLEQITAFGNPSAFAPGSKAIFRVWGEDCEPHPGGEFEFSEKVYSVLAVTPLWRGGTLVKYDVLVGYE